MSKAAREYHLIDLVGISHGGFVSLAGARQFARQEGLSAWTSSHHIIRVHVGMSAARLLSGDRRADIPNRRRRAPCQLRARHAIGWESRKGPRCAASAQLCIRSDRAAHLSAEIPDYRCPGRKAPD